MVGNIYKHMVFSPKAYVVLEIIYQSRTAYSIHLHKIVRSKKNNFKTTCLLEDTNLEEVAKILDKNSYISLSIRGKVLLNDTIQLEEDLIDISTFQLESQFGFGHIDDYVISSYFIEHNCYITAVRHEIVKEWINRINQLKLKLSTLYLGTNTFANYFKGIDLKPGYYTWQNLTLNWDGMYSEEVQEQIESIDLIEQLNKEDSNPIESIGLLALANVVSDYFQFGNPSLRFKESRLKLTEQKEGYYISNFIKKLSYVVLPILFLSLLVNFLLFTQYSKESNQLSEALSANQFKWKIYEELQQKFENNKQVLTRQSRLGSMTYYADQIAHLRPYQVKFSKVDIYPLTEKSMEYSVEENVLFVEGNSSNHSQYQAWIKLLNKTEWVQALETVQYKRDTESGLTTFILKIEINHE